MKETRIKNVKKWNLLITVLALVAIVSSINFLRTLKDDDVDWDGFYYLIHSKSVLLGTAYFIDPARSPIVTLVIPPHIGVARITMIVFHLLTTLVIYLTTLKLTKNKISSALASLFYGVNWWMIDFLRFTLADLPAIFFFLLGFYFSLEDDKKSFMISGLFSGIAFIIRFDIALLIIPVLWMLRKKKNFKYFIIALIFVAIPVEILSNIALYYLYDHVPIFNKIPWVPSSINRALTFYTPYRFFSENLVYYNNFLITNKNSISFNGFSVMAKYLDKVINKFPLMIFLASFSGVNALLNIKREENLKLISLLLFFMLSMMIVVTYSEERLFFAKIIPLAALLSANSVLFIEKEIKSKKLVKYIPLALMLVLILGNVYRLSSIKYKRLDLSLIDYSFAKTENKKICSNYEPALYWFGGIKGAKHLFRVLENVHYEQWKEEIKSSCDYLYYFDSEKVPTWKNRGFDKFLAKEFELIKAQDVGNYMLIYRIN